MSFDPNLPQEGTPLDAVQMRSQLNGLKAIIDAILTVSAAQVDGVNTVEPGNPANATVSVSGNTLHFTFDIPRGNDGLQGQPGGNGSDGSQGPPGAPFTNFVVEGVSTLNPGDNATVRTSFDGSNVRFQFGIPRGQNGNEGSSGPQGPPGEVTNAQLSSAISGTSSNSNAVAALDTPFAEPDAEMLRQKMNELVLALRR